MLAQQRRRAVEGERCIGEIERTDDLRHLARGRMRQLAQHPAMLDLRLGKHLRHRVDGRARNADSVQQGGQRDAVALCEFGAQQRIEQRMIADARRVRGKPLVLSPFRMTQDFGELGELAIVADRQRDKAVGARKDILRLDIGMAVAA